MKPTFLIGNSATFIKMTFSAIEYSQFLYQAFPNEKLVIFFLSNLLLHAGRIIQLFPIDSISYSQSEWFFRFSNSNVLVA